MLPAGEIDAPAAPDGFTLLEVLVVMAVLALITGLAFPRVDRMLESVRFASGRSMVQATAEAARAQAMRTDSTVDLQASGDGQSLISNGRVAAVLPTSVRVEAGQTGPRFFGDGSAAGGTFGVVSSRGRSELVVADGTGAMRWRQ